MEGGGVQSPERSLTRFDEEANQSLVQVVCARLHVCERVCVCVYSMSVSVSVSVSVFVSVFVCVHFLCVSVVTMYGAHIAN